MICKSFIIITAFELGIKNETTGWLTEKIYWSENFKIPRQFDHTNVFVKNTSLASTNRSLEEDCRIFIQYISLNTQKNSHSLVK